MKAILKAMLILVGVGILVAAGTLLFIGSRGISARAEPGRLETAVARTMRRLAIPRGDRQLKNPVAAGPDVVAAGMAHYADHCAACHGNDGSGETVIGLGLYPKVPDMRLEPTQSLSDGELFYIIENGIRLTGMPAWGDGTAESAQGTWHLVHFIRHLPRLTAEEIAQMQQMNPKAPGEQEMDPDAFLNGTEPEAPPSATHKHGGR